MFYSPLSFSFFLLSSSSTILLFSFLNFFIPSSKISQFLLFSLLNLNFPPSPQFLLSLTILIDFFKISDPTSTLHRPHIDPTSTLDRPQIDPTSILHRPYIDPIKTIKMKRKRKKTIKMSRWRRENNKSEEVEVEEGK